MQQLFTLVLCAALTAEMSAQTITAADAPVAGDAITYVDVAWSGSFTNGPAQAWSLVGEPAEQYPIQMIPVAAATGASNFPLATVAASSDDGDVFTFLRTDAGGLDIVGTYYVTDGEIEYYSDPDRWIPYPCAYGDSWVDGYTILDAPGGAVQYTSEPATWIADGYGSLSAPGGTLTNVLKVTQQVSTTETFGDDVIVTESTTTRFWKPGYPLFVASTSVYSYTVNGTPAGGGSDATVIDELANGVQEDERSRIGVNVFPNPANGTDITVDYGSAATTHLRLVNSAGALVYEAALGDRGPGIHRVQLPTAALAAGLYHLELRNAQGERGVVRVVVE